MYDDFNLDGRRISKYEIQYGPKNGNFLSFSPDGRFSGMVIRENSQQALRIAQTKGMSYNAMLIDPLRNLNRLSQQQIQPEIVEALLEILSAQSDATSERLVDRFRSTLLVVRKFNGTAEPVLPIDDFINCIAKLAAELGRPPVRSELAKEMNKTASAITKLCKNSGFEWLPRKSSAPKEWFYHKKTPLCVRSNLTLRTVERRKL